MRRDGSDIPKASSKWSRAVLEEPGAKVVTQLGEPDAQVLKSSSQIVEAIYEFLTSTHTVMEPFQLHCPGHSGSVEIWVGSQDPEVATMDASKITGVPGSIFISTIVFWAAASDGAETRTTCAKRLDCQQLDGRPG